MHHLHGTAKLKGGGHDLITKKMSITPENPQEILGKIQKYLLDANKECLNGSIQAVDIACMVDFKAGQYLLELLEAANARNTMETGLAYGGSCLFFLYHQLKNRAKGLTEGTHYAIDPYQKTWFEGIALTAARNLGLSGYLEFINQSSSMTLPEMVSNGQRVQFAFIDGDHRFDCVMNDFFYIKDILEVGGFVVFDDAQDVAPHFIGRMAIETLGYELVPSKAFRFLVLKKTKEDDRMVSSPNTSLDPSFFLKHTLD